MSTLSIWHPINGEWVHILQQVREHSTAYYTNGEFVAIEYHRDVPYVFKPVEKPRQSLKSRRDEARSE